MEAKLSNGLLTGHAYSVTGLHTVSGLYANGTLSLQCFQILCTRNEWPRLESFAVGYFSIPI